jgi:Mg/Co/Ni transporter MgtE
MTMTKPNSLVADYARTDPSGFVHSLKGSQAKEIGKVLQQLPENIAAHITTRLSSRMMYALYSENPTAYGSWVEGANAEDAKTLLLHLPKSKRRLLIKNLSNGKRQAALKRIFSYPNHSVGRHVSSDFIVVSESMLTTGVIDIIKQHTPELPVVVLGEDNTYCGLLNPRKVLEGNWDQPVKTYVDEVDALIAESSALDALDLTQWLSYPLLAVVDHENHVLGVIAQTKLKKVVATAPDIEKSEDLLTGAYELYSKIFRGLVDGIFGVRSR